MADVEENHDVFADDAVTNEAAENDAPAKKGATDEGGEAEVTGKAATETEGSEGTEQQQGEDEAAPPAAEGRVTARPDKMIHESRFKAAIKDVNKQLLEAQQELATLKAQPAPDRANDPVGYERHVRLETSKAVMMQRFPDYAETISHYQEMAKVNPVLNDMVSAAEAPAAMAYDLAKKDLELKELIGMKDSDEWKQFQSWKAAGGVTAPQTDVAKQLGAVKAADATAKIPNLNRNATASSPNIKSKDEGSDDLFSDHYSVTS